MEIRVTQFPENTRRRIQREFEVEMLRIFVREFTEKLRLYNGETWLQILTEFLGTFGEELKENSCEGYLRDKVTHAEVKIYGQTHT
ncbi:hypothetical protein K0M31_008360, partial [Melipona bicolor]